MTLGYVLLAIPAGIVGLIVLYWIALRILFPGRERADEVHSVRTEDGWLIQLYRYKPENEDGGEPVLLCHGAFANHHNFDIPEGNCLAEYLRDAGYDCWLMDFRGDRSSTAPPGKSRNQTTLDEYLLEDLPAAVTFVKLRTGYETIHGLGHSMGGMLFYAYDLTFEDADLASLTTLGSPVGFGAVPHKELKWLVGWFRRAHWLCTMVQQMLVPYLHIFKVSNAAVPINWSNTPKNLSIRDSLHSIEVLPWRVADALDTWAANDNWIMCDGELNVVQSLPFLRTPLFAIYAEKDRLTNPDYVQEFFDSIKLTDKKILFVSEDKGHSIDYDHIDLVFGHDAKEEIFLPIREWLEAHPADRAVDTDQLLTPTRQEAPADATEEVTARTSRPTPADLLLQDDDDEMDSAAMDLESEEENEVGLDVDGDEDDKVARQRQRLGRVMGDIQAAFEDVDEETQPGSAGKRKAKTKQSSTKKKASSKKKSTAKKSSAKPAAKKKSGTKKKSSAKSKSGSKKPAAKKKPSNKKSSAKKKSTSKKSTAKKKPASKKRNTKKSQ